MVESKKLFPVVLVTVAAALAQFDSPIDPLSRANTEEKQQNRTFSSDKNYNSLNRAGMAVGMIDIHDQLVKFDMGLSGQKLAYGDSGEIKNIAISAPRFTVGTPGKIVFSANYGNVPMRKKVSNSKTMYMPQHRFGVALAAQAPEGVFRFGFNLDGFGGKSKYEEGSDSGRAILGAENLGISFGAAPQKFVSLDLGVYASGYIDTLFGTKKGEVAGETKMLNQERIAEVELPRITAHIRLGDTSATDVNSFDFTYGKKQFVYASRNDIKANDPANDTSSWPNLDAIVTDSIRWNIANRLHFIPVENRVEINPSLEFGYMHDRFKRMKPGKDNHPWKYNGENENKRWETSSFRFGLGLDFLFANCVNYWTEYGHSTMKLKLTGSDLAKIAKFDTHKEGFNRFATGTELAIHDISGVKFRKEGQLFVNMSFMTLQESGIVENNYGFAQYKHLTNFTTGTQQSRYEPWIAIKEKVKTNDFTIGLRGTFSEQLIGLGGRIHLVNQTVTNSLGGDDSKYHGPQYEFNFTYNLTPKAYAAKKK